MLNWRQSKCLVASIANAALVCLPACVINGGYAPPYAAVAIFVAAVCEGLALSPQRVDRNSTKNRLVMLWNIAHGIAVLISLQALTVMANTSPPAGEECRLIGVALLMVGLTLRTAAIRALGEHFADGFEPSAARRVIAGPYRFIRHPAESGLLLIIAGYGTLVCGWSIFTTAMFAFLSAVSTMRVMVEERALQLLPVGKAVAVCDHRLVSHQIHQHGAYGSLRSARISPVGDSIRAYLGNAYP